MSSLKLNKITISNLDPTESAAVVGGRAAESSLPCVSIGVSLFFTITTGRCGCTPDDMTCRPGHQDTCGLCTELPDEEVEE